MEKLKKKYGSNHWQIAYRLPGQKEFALIENPRWAWAADPFLVEYRGEIYLFAELFLYNSERNGVIGYCKLEGENFGKWIVTMDKHWHLSYPNVFVYQNKLYICPESYQREEIGIYELKEFPDKWEKVKTFLPNEMCVDTTFFTYDSEKYMFTFKPSFKKFGGKLYLYKIENGSLSSPLMISENQKGARPGGNVFTKNGKLIRVGQDCEHGYGTGLVFNEILSVWPKYSEIEQRSVYVQDINENWKEKFIGLHTYNTMNGIEVIDLKFKHCSLKEWIAKKRVRKIFLNKYPL